MVANKETDENIQAVVADFKQKYAQTTQTESKNKLPLIDRAINTGAKVTDTIFGGGKIGETIGTLGGYAYTKGKDILGGDFEYFGASIAPRDGLLGKLIGGNPYYESFKSKVDNLNVVS